MSDFDVFKRNEELHDEIKTCIRKYCPYLFDKVLNNFTNEIHVICGNYTNDILEHLTGGMKDGTN